VIIVLIAGILASAAVPAVTHSLSAHRVQSAAQRVKLDLEHARRRARVSSTSQSVEFDSASSSYTLPGISHLDHPGIGYAVDLAGPPYNSLIASADFGGDEQVIFNGYGLPDSGGAVVLQSGRHQRTVTLDAEQGKATIQ
jgi:hypothetical protein